MPAFVKIVFDTADMPENTAPQVKARRWIETFDRAGYNADLACPNIPHGFEGRAAMVMGEGLAVARTKTSSMIVARRKGHVASDSDDGVTIYLNTGNTRQGGEQFGHDVEVDPGQAYVLTHGATFRALAPIGGEAIGIKVASSMLAGWGLDPGDLAARNLDCSGAAYAMMQGYARLVIDHGTTLDDLTARAVQRHMSELVGLWLGAGKKVFEEHDRGAAMQARLGAVRQAIRQQAIEPGFSIQAVAGQLGISVRYVQHILSQAGENFSQLVAQSRLEQARMLLLDPAFDELPVAAIAFRCGFAEVTSFYRAFRAAFDMTPAALREARKGGLRF